MAASAPILLWALLLSMLNRSALPGGRLKVAETLNIACRFILVFDWALEIPISPCRFHSSAKCVFLSADEKVSSQLSPSTGCLIQRAAHCLFLFTYLRETNQYSERIPKRKWWRYPVRRNNRKTRISLVSSRCDGFWGAHGVRFWGAQECPAAQEVRHLLGSLLSTR